jgi:hypothetical protein
MGGEAVDPTSELVGSTFYAVAFIWDYLQLQFDGPRPLEHHHLQLEMHPRIRVGGGWLTWGEPGYRDALCDQFGSVVRRAETETEGEQIIIELDNDTLIAVSLRLEEFDTPEAADYTHSLGQERLGGALWTETWKDDWKRLYGVGR